MKNFYILAIALSVTASAFASTPVKSKAVNQIAPAQQSYQASLQSKKARTGVPAKAVGFENLDQVAGQYDWTCNSLRTTPGPGECNMTIKDAATGEVEIDVPSLFYVDVTNPLKGFVDLENGTFIINNLQKIGTDQDGDVYFYLKGVDEEGYLLDGASDDAYVEGTINGTTITFPVESVFCFGDPNREDLGWWYITYNNKFEHVATTTGDPNAGWTSVGNATFMDGWVLPAFGIDQTNTDYWYEVELQQNDEDKNLYRLVDPYHGNFPLIDYNESTSVGYIQFNIANPDYVYFDVVEAGFANSQLRIDKFYCYNNMTWAMNYLSLPIEGAIEAFGTQFFATTYADGQVYVGIAPEYGSDACFGIQYDKNGAYQWTNDEGDYANMEARIIFPTQDGISGINADNNAPVEYYNLQGLRVANPEKGQVVISRQGNKVAKFVVK